VLPVVMESSMVVMDKSEQPSQSIQEKDLEYDSSDDSLQETFRKRKKAHQISFYVSLLNANADGCFAQTLAANNDASSEFSGTSSNTEYFELTKSQLKEV